MDRDRFRRLVQQGHDEARRILTERLDDLHTLAKALLEWETIDAEQINDIMEGRPPRAPKPPIATQFGNSAGGTPGPAAGSAPATA